MDLGLPLQGPGWTDYPCVQGYVGMQLHVILLDTVYWTELVCVFLHNSPSICCYQQPGFLLFFYETKLQPLML